MMDLIEQQSGKHPFKKLSGAINALPDGQMKKSLRVMAARSKGDADTFIGELEQWFDHGMDRASGWYKRKSQALMLPIALLLIVVSGCAGHQQVPTAQLTGAGNELL